MQVSGLSCERVQVQVLEGLEEVEEVQVEDMDLCGEVGVEAQTEEQEWE